MSLHERLKPTHLKSTEELLAESAEALAPTQKPAEEKLLEDPRSKPVYAFHFSHKTARGKVYHGDFEVRIPTIRDRDQMHLIQSRLRGGQPVESFSMLALELHLIQAHLAVCLTKSPDWAKKLDELHDFTVIQELYEEVRSHENYFLGWGENQSPSPDERKDGDGGTSKVVE